MFQVTDNGSGSFVAQYNGSTVAGIEPRDGGFKVNVKEGSALPEMGMFSTLALATQAVRDFLGIEEAPAPRKRGSSKSGSSAPAKKSPAKDASTSAPAKSGSSKGKKTAPAPVVRKVSPIMQRNLDEIALGNYPVFVGEVDTLATIRSKFRALVSAGVAYKNGTANIYPTPAQAKRIAKLVPDTDTAIQCALGGYTPWRNSRRKHAVAPAQ